MPRLVCVAATQASCQANKEVNVEKAEGLVRAAAADGAQIICIQVRGKADFQSHVGVRYVNVPIRACL